MAGSLRAVAPTFIMAVSPSAEWKMQDANAPVTNAEFQQGMQQLKSEFAGDLQQVKDELTETMRDIQTELLKAFYSVAKSNEARFDDAELSDRSIRQRVSAVESRITEIERRLNLPPAA
jgi:hypothetical protein